MRLLSALAAQAQNLLATAALAAITVGCWMERPSLALLVPGTIVFASLVYTRLRGG